MFKREEGNSGHTEEERGEHREMERGISLISTLTRRAGGGGGCKNQEKLSAFLRGTKII